MYVDTVLLLNNELIGHRTRLASKLIEATRVSLDDIEKVEIYSEFPRTEKAEK